MKTALAEIVSRIQQERRTGLLSFTILGNSGLFKVFFKDGAIYHLACGSMKGSECPAQIDTCDESLGRLADKVEIKNAKGELATLAKSVDRMRVSMKKLLE